MRLPNVKNLIRQESVWRQDLTKRELLWMGVKSAGITGMTAWLYYRTWWALLPLLPVGIWYMKQMEREQFRKKEMEFQLQFKEAILAVSSALNTGYSVENAFQEAQKEMKLVYPSESRISKELQMMVRQLRIQIPVEQVLEELAGRVQMEDVRSFAVVFAAAKRSGGDMISIIQSTVRQIGDKIDVRREIDTVLAAKQYEFRVMSAIPYGIIGYMSLSFPEFMNSLYGNVVGIGVMTVCLAIYMGAYYLGLKIIRIEV